MAGKPRRKPAPQNKTPTVAETPGSAAPALPPASGIKYDADDPLGSAEKLSVREREVLFWMAAGKQNDEIATITGTSKRTVEKHIAHLLFKLDVDNRNAAVALYHHRRNLEQQQEIERLQREVEVLQAQIAALRRELRRKP